MTVINVYKEGLLNSVIIKTVTLHFHTRGGEVKAPQMPCTGKVRGPRSHANQYGRILLCLLHFD